MSYLDFSEEEAYEEDYYDMMDYYHCNGDCYNCFNWQCHLFYSQE